MKERLVKTLFERVAELEAFAKVNRRRVEPHLYPYGLFRAQTHPEKRYEMSAYLAEIKVSLRRLSNQPSTLMCTRLAEDIQQKIAVLTVSFRSQPLRRQKRTALNSIIAHAHSHEKNAFQYFCEEETRTHIDKIKDELFQKKSRLSGLKMTLERKKEKLKGEKRKRFHVLLNKECDALTVEVSKLGEEIVREQHQLNDIKKQ